VPDDDLVLALADHLADRLADQLAARLADLLARPDLGGRAAARDDPKPGALYDASDYTSYYTRADRSADPSAHPFADASAGRSGDPSASRSADRSARQPADRSADPAPDALWTARRVAAHYGVTPTFVYHHADELGCLRLGAGPRPRLRFDPRTVRERWSHLGALPPVGRQRPQPRRPRRRADRAGKVELLGYDRDP
jgi:hypothetical protein